jgi:hypothetical protein
MDNQAIAKAHLEAKEEYYDKFKGFPSLNFLEPLFIVDVFAVPCLFVVAKKFGDYSKIIGVILVILLLPFVIRMVSWICCKIRNPKLGKRLDEARFKAIGQAIALDRLYKELQKNFRDVQEYVLPQNIEEHIRKWKETLGVSI